MEGDDSIKEVRQDQVQRNLDVGHEDVLMGWEYCATLQLRTPLVSLEHHGEVVKGVDAQLPAYGPGWAGIWVPKTKSWAELGLPIREPLPGTMASQIGPVPSDGGAFLAFLREYRRIVEKTPSVEDQETAVAALAKRAEYSDIVVALGASIFDECYDRAEHEAIEKLSAACQIGYSIATSLYEAGLRDPDSVRRASDTTLLAVDRLGHKTLGKIRAALGPPPAGEGS